MNNTLSDPAVEHFLGELARVKQNLSSNTQPWLQELQQSALTHFSTHGFPSLRDENWKYTNVTPITKRNFKFAVPQTLKNITLPVISAEHHRLTFVDGYFSAELSQLNAIPKGVVITNLAETLIKNPKLITTYLGQANNQNNAFNALNTCFIHDGAYIELPENTKLDKPIELLFITNEEASFSSPRNLIVVKENSHAIIIENHININYNSHFTNTTTEIFLDDYARIEHYNLLQENNQSLYVGNLNVQQQANSYFHAFNLTLGSALARCDTHVSLNAEHAECFLTGLYLAKDKQHIDHHTFIDHKKPHGTSHEFYKGIIGDNGRAVFNGKVMVRPGAFKTDAHQTNKNLLLSQEAEIDTKPELEIYADDVKCAHGATVGQLDESALFYLRSRGFSENEARNTLIQAFARDIIERIPLASLRTHMENKLKDYLTG